MFQWIGENAGTINVSIVLAALVTGIVVRLWKDKKRGKSSCGCNCSCCLMGGTCRKPSRLPRFPYTEPPKAALIVFHIIRHISVRTSGILPRDTGRFPLRSRILSRKFLSAGTFPISTL